MLLIDATGRVFWRYPRPGQVPAMPFRFDDDTFFGPVPDRIISNQEEQHTIQIISIPQGRVLWRYGHVNAKGSGPGYLNTPDDAYLLKSGLISVADAYNCRVIFISRGHRIVRRLGTGPGRCLHAPPQALGAVNGATPLADGGTLVSEIHGSWIDDVGPKGNLRWAVQAPVSYPSDPQLLGPNRILVADYARPGGAVIMTRTGRVLWRYAPAAGPGMLDHPSLALLLSPGLIAINDDYRHRVVVVSIRSRRIVWQYGHTDVAGSAPGYLNTPDGLDLLTTARAEALPGLRRLLSAQPGRSRQPLDSSLTVTRAPYRLPAPVQREVAVADGSHVLLAGGLDAAGRSTNGVFQIEPTSGTLTSLGTLPQPFHDAAGALLGTRLFVFGGGTGQSSATVQGFDLTTRRGTLVGSLPRALSDLVSVQAGKTVYLVGGYDGVAPRAEIYATTDGTHFRLAGRLPIGVRYPAVAAAGSKLVIAGGLTSTGPSDAVYAFDPASGRTRRLGTLPIATAHAAAVTLGSRVLVLGGTPAVSVSVHFGKTATVSALHDGVGLADTGAAVVADRGFLFGGTRAGRATTSVYELRVR
jgi:outer membrane protein assembly factor BamB